MRFKTDLKNIRTFSKLVAALSSLEKVCWVRLDDETARFTAIPDTGSQVWASLPMDFIFENYHIQSAEDNNTINLELPLAPLQRALRTAQGSTAASIRLTKRDGVPVLSMTISTVIKEGVANSGTGGGGSGGFGKGVGRGGAGGDPSGGHGYGDYDGGDPFAEDAGEVYAGESLELSMRRADREKTITQDIPVRVLHPDTVETIMQPKVREPDVHIQLPPLLQLKAISDRFTRLATTTASSSSSSLLPVAGALAAASGGGTSALLSSRSASAGASPKLELSANMHGSLRLRIGTDTLDIESVWNNLDNPELDQAQLTMPLAEHPSTLFKAAGPSKWASVRVDGRDWSKVLSVGRLEGRVIACFADEHALILYVYVPQYDDGGAEDCVVTYYVSSYSA